MKTFRPGMFYGAVARRRQVGAIALAELQPTVPEHDVETHSHDDAHFVLVLAGRYVSSAHGMPAVCASPALIYNPPGTVHRDCFRGLEGRFFTLSIPAGALGDRALPTRAIRPDLRSERHAFALRAALHGDDSAALDIETGLEALLDSLQHRQRLERSDGPAWLARARDRLRATARTRRASTTWRGWPACIQWRSRAPSAAATAARRANICANAGWNAPPRCCAIANGR